MELVGLDHPDLISLLLSNRAKIAYVIRWRQAESEAARHAIAEELLADASLDGASVLKALEANRSTKEWGLVAQRAGWNGARGATHAEGAGSEAGRGGAARGGDAGRGCGAERAEAEGAAVAE